MRSPVRMARRAWLLLSVAIGLALVAPGAAFAHATLLETKPDNDAILPESPRQVLLRYDEAVESALGAIRVYDGEGNEVETGDIVRPSPDRVVVSIDEPLQRGTYTVTWAVISADSDPIDGAFVFHVQEPGPQPAGVAAEVLEGTPFGISFLYAAGRFFDYTLMLLCVGGVVALLFVLPSAQASIRDRLIRILIRAAGALAVVALIGLVLQAAAAGNLSLTEAARWDPVSQVIETKFGTWSLVRASLAIVLAVLLWTLARSRGTAEQVAAGLVCLGLVITPVSSGHASVSGAVAYISDVAHVQAAAVWTGGLGVLVLALVMARQDRWTLATRAVPRFSNLAVGAVVVLIVAGAVNGVIQLGAWDAGLFQADSWRGLWDTTYGLLLLAKIALVIPVVALGAYNNRFAVPRLRAGIASVLERRRFLRSVGGEVTLMVAIIGVTAVLVNAAPARMAVEEHGAVAKTVDFGDMQAHVSVDPATAGRNDIHLEFKAKQGGEAPELEDVRVSATLASRRVGPLRFKAEQSHGGHGAYEIPRANLPIAGDWQFRVEARRGEFESFAETVSIPIEEES